MVNQTDTKRGVINILIVVSACLAIYFGLYEDKTLFMFLKPLTTILVITLLLFASKNSNIQLGNRVTIALVFCLLGDILLLFEAYFLFGLVAFLIAHVLFSVAFVQYKGFDKNWLSFLILFSTSGF